MISYHVVIDEYHVYENKVIRYINIDNIYQSNEEAKKCILEERKNK